MNQVLDAACDNGDLTRQGVLDAFNGLEDVDTGGLVVPIRGFEVGKSPSLESFVLQPADVPVAPRSWPRPSRASSRRRSPADLHRARTAPPPLGRGRRRACQSWRRRATGSRRSASSPVSDGGHRQRHRAPTSPARRPP